MSLVLDEEGAALWNHLPEQSLGNGVLKSSPSCVIKDTEKMAQKNALGGTGGETPGSSFYSLSAKDQGNLEEIMKLLHVLEFGSCSLRGTISY